MSWLDRRAVMGSDEASMPYAATFATAIDRSFPVDDAAIDRIRGRVLGAFVEAAPAPSAPRLGRPVRRGLTIALAATVGLFAFGSVAVEAQPGGPFYSLKLAIETATLPSIAVPAGWEARLGRLEDRLDESLAAQRRGNRGAVMAALAEYRSELAGLTAAIVNPVRRSQLLSLVSRDLAIVVGLAETSPSEAAGLLLADMRAIVGSTDPSDGNLDPGGRSIGNPHADDAVGNPHSAGNGPPVGGATGNPHAEGATGDPHASGATGNPHTDGATGNPHTGGSTANPHTGGSTGNPHAGGSTGNPHAPGSTGNPHTDGATGNPHAGKGDPKPNPDASEA